MATKLVTSAKDWWIDEDGMACLDSDTIPVTPMGLIGVEVVIEGIGDDHPIAVAIRHGRVRIDVRPVRKLH